MGKLPNSRICQKRKECVCVCVCFVLFFFDMFGRRKTKKVPGDSGMKRVLMILLLGCRDENSPLFALKRFQKTLVPLIWQLVDRHYKIHVCSEESAIPITRVEFPVPDKKNLLCVLSFFLVFFFSAFSLTQCLLGRSTRCRFTL